MAALSRVSWRAAAGVWAVAGALAVLFAAHLSQDAAYWENLEAAVAEEEAAHAAWAQHLVRPSAVRPRRAAGCVLSDGRRRPPLARRSSRASRPRRR